MAGETAYGLRDFQQMSRVKSTQPRTLRMGEYTLGDSYTAAPQATSHKPRFAKTELVAGSLRTGLLHLPSCHEAILVDPPARRSRLDRADILLDALPKRGKGQCKSSGNQVQHADHTL